MRKTIALVAHDARKPDLVEWVEYNWQKLADYNMVCTGTTGRMVYEVIESKATPQQMENIQFKRMKSGPLGGDQQLGALIAEGGVDYFIFFWDAMTAQPHDVDVKALLRIATMYNIPTAMNRATADFMISSPLFEENYERGNTDFAEYTERKL